MNERVGRKNKKTRDNCTMSSSPFFPERLYANDWFLPLMKHIFFSSHITYILSSDELVDIRFYSLFCSSSLLCMAF